MNSVRLTIQPDTEVQVSDLELVDLERFGLVIRTEAKTPEGIRKAAEKRAEGNS